MVAYTTASLLGSGKGRRPKLTDFVLRWTRRRQQTAEEQLNLLRALAARQEANARVDNR